MDHETPRPAPPAETIPLVFQATTSRLTIHCFGRVELPEDEPIFGTYWSPQSTVLGVGTSLSEAMALAERRILRLPTRLKHVPQAIAFAPERIQVRDSEGRLALGGKVAGRTIEWCMPVISNDEASRLRNDATDLRVEAAVERGWDNYSTAQELERRASLLELRLVDPRWQAQAANALRVRESSDTNSVPSSSADSA